MSTLVITAQAALCTSGVIAHPVVRVEDGYITSILGRDDTESLRDAGIMQSFPEAILVPAYLDIHLHGAVGHDVMDTTADGLRRIEGFLASRGVGAFFPTTATSSVQKILSSLDILANEIERAPSRSYDGAIPVGIHLEGPFISPVKRGAHPPDHILEPSVAMFERFWQAARGHIRLMTIAPELPGAVQLIEHATGRGVTCSLGHSNATAEEAEAAFRAGARSATHTFNAMRSLNHRDPGLAGYALDNESLFAEIICDGIHVAPALVRLFFKAKGPERSILVTDGAGAMGMPEGRFNVRGREIELKDGRCTWRGMLAGSICPMDEAVRNLARFTRSGIFEATRVASHNPAKLTGLEDQWGSLEEGREANILALSRTGEIRQIFRAGRSIINV